MKAVRGRARQLLLAVETVLAQAGPGDVTLVAPFRYIAWLSRARDPRDRSLPLCRLECNWVGTLASGQKIKVGLVRDAHRPALIATRGDQHFVVRPEP